MDVFQIPGTIERLEGDGGIGRITSVWLLSVTGLKSVVFEIRPRLGVPNAD